MEEAEHALWREAGLSIAPPESKIGWPRVAASFEFHHPLRFEDEFLVEIRIVTMTDKTIRYQCSITREDRKIATGTMTIACVSKVEQPIKSVTIPPEIAARFQVAEPE
jgi:acyl-CoA thioesterase FadM